MFNMSIEVKVVSSHGNAGGGGAEDPEATEVDDLGVDAREAGGAHGAERLPVQVAAVGRLHLQRRVGTGVGAGLGTRVGAGVLVEIYLLHVQMMEEVVSTTCSGVSMRHLLTGYC